MAENSKDRRKKLILALFHDSLYVPMKRKELAIFMQVTEESRGDFDTCIDELINEGKIELTKRGKLMLVDERSVSKSDKTLIGVYTGNQKGFGFVTVEGQPEDYFIPEGMNLNAFHGDTVEIIPETGYVPKDRRREGKVIRIVEQAKDVFVGTFEASKNFGFVVPDNSKFDKDIFIPAGKAKDAVTGSKVVINITDYGDARRNPEGEVVRVIGHEDDPGVDILSISLAFGIQDEFPEKVLNQAERALKPVSEADMEGRTDLRELLTVTIDGEDSKDLDDAVSLEKEGELFVLGVHIADVSNYVQENSAIDREALKRGTSVYLADRVIPMLPHALSNGICSLNEGEDRLTLSCIMKFDGKGTLKDYKITESVIRTAHRMNYTEVNRIIADGDEALIEKYSDVAPMLLEMQKLSLVLRERRIKRGAVDFDFPETKIILDKEGEPIEIKPYERNEATRLIESFMLAANETVAEHYYWQGVPFLYRVHGEPEEEKFRKLQTFIKNFGYNIKGSGNEIHPKEFQKLLAKIEGTDAEALISRLVLRSMQQAKYSPDCEGHFGLACDYYTHFTSPIRRYPDLQIHRIIKDDLRGRLTDFKKSHYEKLLPEVAQSSSKAERRADECERETVKLKKARYMQKHIGDIYEGVISGVTKWGIYVELENTVEGLVHVSTLTGDYYVFNEQKYELCGERSGITYRLGEKIRVLCRAVDITTRTVDFIIADFDEGSAVHNFYKEGRSVF
ncbi:MAG: ribonuclease R [Lachnospiraceae bacterium]|nr:ribonuclease R [Lachnospiraceae bacterium]